MKILICGMPRSMTTWAFNAVREALGGQPLKTLWIDPGDAKTEAEFAESVGNVLAKCHHYSVALANAADCVIYSYRDIRTAAVSNFRKFSSDCTIGQLDAWVQAGRDWGRVADTILRYEQVERDPAGALRHLRRMLKAKYGAESLSRETDEVLLSRVDTSFAERQAAEKISYDARTMILPAHRTFQPPPENLNEVEKNLYLRVEREFASWLSEHFYVQGESQAERLDYRLSAKLMSRLASPVVVDVPAQPVSDPFEQRLPDAIDLLKVDTDGHDLAVLCSLDVLCPRFVLAKYEDATLEASGKSAYTLADLHTWAASRSYCHSVVIRRHGRTESLEWDAPWTRHGDRGHVLFIRDMADLPLVRTVVAELAPEALARHQEYVEILIKDCEVREATIRRLDNALKELQSQQATPSAPDDRGQDLAASKPPAELERYAELERELVRKEAVIQEQARALAAYRPLSFVLSPVLLPLSFVYRRARAALHPRLGTLNQYPPRKLKLPDPYACSLPAESLPSISLITPSFQQAQFIGRTIESVLSQGYPKLEYFVQDGGSTDGTVDVLQQYGDRLTGWLSEKDGGQSHAINLGFGRTRGEIMAWLNSDDLLMPGALHRVAEYFAQHPEVDVVYGHRILIDDDDREIGRWVLPAHDDEVLSWADFVPQETLFWRRTIWEKAGGQIDESFRFAMDWELLLRLRDAGARMVRMPDFLGAFRIHEAQKTSAQINDVGMGEMAQLRKRALGREVTWPQIRGALWPYMMKHMALDLAYRLKK